MSTIPGNNITLGASVITSSSGNYIIRTPTTDSNDTFDTANNLLIELFGEDSFNFVGSSFNFTIYNDSNNTITMNSGTGITILPTDPDLILPMTIRSYTGVQTSVGNVSILVTAAASASNNTDITLIGGNILVGDTDDIANGVTMVGDASIDNSGSLTLVDTGVSSGSYLSADLIVDSKGRITTISDGTTQAFKQSIQGALTNFSSGGNSTTYARWASGSDADVDGISLGYEGKVIRFSLTYTNDNNIGIGFAEQVSFSVGITDSTMSVFTPFTGGTDIITWDRSVNGTKPISTIETDFSFSSTDRLAVRSVETGSVIPTDADVNIILVLENFTTTPVVGELLYLYDDTGGQEFPSTSSTGEANDVIRGLTLATGGPGNVISDNIYNINQVVGSIPPNDSYTYITLTRSGVYEVSFWVTVQSNGLTGSSRSQLNVGIETDITGGTTFSQVAGSLATTYCREQNNGITNWGAGKTILLVVTNTITNFRVNWYKNLAPDPLQSLTGITPVGKSSLSVKWLRT